MTMQLRGKAKLMEECGELVQALAKQLAYWHTDVHPDGSNLPERIVDEMGDVAAALDFVLRQTDNALVSRFDARRQEKRRVFLTWDAEVENADDAVDAAPRVLADLAAECWAWADPEALPGLILELTERAGVLLGLPR